ncbi:MGDG synthase family glycosyltransferase [Bacillus sp. AK128]
MPKVLFFPLLQIPSGHHQVITSLSEQFDQSGLGIQYKSVELLSAANNQLERLISTVYLKWIDTLPSLYHWIYVQSVYRSLHKEKRFIHYEWLFLSSMRRLIHEHQPDFIICSHALPSYLSSRLKQNGECSASIINVYTDFFIHHIWGTKQVDGHFISVPTMKEYLLTKGVPEQSIYQTGIPVHSEFQKQIKHEGPKKNDFTVLLSGGSLGVGKIEHLLSRIPVEGKIHYYVLCGNNSSLYTRLLNKQHPRITPFPYITSKKQMNLIYHSVDAVLTKPGGITISECLTKRLPIFIYDYLPGQEKINVDVLSQNQLITILPINESIHFEDKLLERLNSGGFVGQHSKRMARYHQEISHFTVTDFIKASMG